MTYTVEAEGICKSFSGHAVLDHVDLAVETPPQDHVLIMSEPEGTSASTTGSCRALAVMTAWSPLSMRLMVPPSTRSWPAAQSAATRSAIAGAMR